MMKTHLTRPFSGLALVICLAMFTYGVAHGADASVVKLVRQGDKWQLLRNGKPYFIKGGGGGGPKERPGPLRRQLLPHLGH